MSHATIFVNNQNEGLSRDKLGFQGYIDTTVGPDFRKGNHMHERCTGFEFIPVKPQPHMLLAEQTAKDGHLSGVQRQFWKLVQSHAAELE